jgi:mannosyltransferase
VARGPALMARTPALALLALALILGAGLRFYRLGTAELTADEAASWAGATAPDLRAIIERQRSLDPGKLALYDVVLHGWIGLNGDGVGSMRALSALLGTIAIALVFAATRELLLDLGGAAEIRRAELGAALAALIAAVNLTLVDQARTVRMYPLTLVLELAQVICFLRAASPRARGPSRFASLVGIAVFSALATASNFTAALLIAAEALWLGWAMLRRRGVARAGAEGGLHLLGPALALGAGMALLGPMAPMAGRISIAVVHAGVLDWSHLRPPWWPLEMLRSASGKAPFLLLLPLAMYAMYEGWRTGRAGNGAALGFVLWWMLAPVALVMAVSYAFTPFEEMRYVISSVAAFFILAGVGLAAIDNTRLRLALLVLVVTLSLDHVRRDFIKPQYVQWREATALALAAAAPGGPIAVVPAYAVNVVRYYLPLAWRASVEPAGEPCEMRQRVLLLGGAEVLTPARLAALRDCAPLVVGRLRLVEVRKR